MMFHIFCTFCMTIYKLGDTLTMNLLNQDLPVMLIPNSFPLVINDSNPLDLGLMN